MLFRDQVLAIK